MHILYEFSYNGCNSNFNPLFDYLFQHRIIFVITYSINFAAHLLQRRPHSRASSLYLSCSLALYTCDFTRYRARCHDAVCVGGHAGRLADVFFQPSSEIYGNLPFATDGTRDLADFTTTDLPLLFVSTGITVF